MGQRWGMGWASGRTTGRRRAIGPCRGRTTGRKWARDGSATGSQVGYWTGQQQDRSTDMIYTPFHDFSAIFGHTSAGLRS